VCWDGLLAARWLALGLVILAMVIVTYLLTLDNIIIQP
jgi:hypothetical protein